MNPIISNIIFIWIICSAALAALFVWMACAYEPQKESKNKNYRWLVVSVVALGPVSLIISVLWLIIGGKKDSGEKPN